MSKRNKICSHVVQGEIRKKYEQFSGNNGFLGCPITDELPTPDGVGRYNHFKGGSIYWHPKTGAHEIHGDIRRKWADLGWEKSFLGYPTSDHSKTADQKGRFVHFQRGSIYWHPKTGAHVVKGGIKRKWAQFGKVKGLLGYPVTDELATPDRKGRFNHFQGGSIYWHPDTGAHEIHGAIRNKWASLGWEKSFLGYPVTDHRKTPDGKGRYVHFQGGSIYWHPKTEAYVVKGEIRKKWAELGWEKGFLKYPATDELTTPDGTGQYNHFQGGSIYWYPGLGAYEVHGAIRDKWAKLGWEKGLYGYPVTDELRRSSGLRYSVFENGVIAWKKKDGAFEMEPSTKVSKSQSEKQLNFLIAQEIKKISGYEFKPIGNARLIAVHARFQRNGEFFPKVVQIHQDFDIVGHPAKMYLDFFAAIVIENDRVYVRVVDIHKDGDVDAVIDFFTFGLSELIADALGNDEVANYLRQKPCIPIKLFDNQPVLAVIPRTNLTIDAFIAN